MEGTVVVFTLDRTLHFLSIIPLILLILTLEYENRI